MRYVLRLFDRIPLISLTSESDEDLEEDEYDQLGGGETHNFDRSEPFVDQRYDWGHEDRTFGFGGRP